MPFHIFVRLSEQESQSVRRRFEFDPDNHRYESPRTSSPARLVGDAALCRERIVRETGWTADTHRRERAAPPPEPETVEVIHEVAVQRTTQVIRKSCRQKQCKFDFDCRLKKKLPFRE